MAPGLLPIQSRWDAPLVTALTAVIFGVFSFSPVFLGGPTRGTCAVVAYGILVEFHMRCVRSERRTGRFGPWGF